MKKTLLSLVAMLGCIALAHAQYDALRTRIAAITAGKKADIGVGLIDLTTGDTLSVHGNRHYMTQSVYKFHLALAMMAEVDKGNFQIDQPIFVRKADLLPDMWSPLRDEYPKGEVLVPLRKIMDYTVGKSDNSGCDLMFKLLGGTQVVQAYIQSLGIKDVSIAATEHEIEQSKGYQLAAKNWTTPRAAAELLRIFAQKHILSDSSHAILWRMMVNASSGPKRIKGLLPAGVVVGHKTGTAGTHKGFTPATNDIGILQLPNGKQLALAVFVCDSYETPETNERIIAEIAQAVCEAFMK